MVLIIGLRDAQRSLLNKISAYRHVPLYNRYSNTLTVTCVLANPEFKNKI